MENRKEKRRSKREIRRQQKYDRYIKRCAPEDLKKFKERPYQVTYQEKFMEGK